MWLTPRETNGLWDRTPIPDSVRAALVRWYTGNGDDADHRASVTLTLKAREHGQWIACDCLSADERPPLLSPSYLSVAETYYLRRLTSVEQGRREHHRDCPFQREQAPPRDRAKSSATPTLIKRPTGFFSDHAFARERLAQKPDEAEPDDRARGVATPRLAKLLWLLMDQAHVNVVDELGARDEAGIAGEFGRLKAAARGLEMAPGIPLARHLHTHISAFDSEEVHARIRASAPSWPDGHAPHAFLLLYAIDISGTRVMLADGHQLEVETRVQHDGFNGEDATGPFLVLAVVGEHSTARGIRALRAYAQPIAEGSHFVAVHSAAERDAVRQLIRARYGLARGQVGLAFKKVLFDLDSRLGPVRPDLMLEIRDRRRDALIECAMEVLSGDDEERLGMKERQIAALAELGEVIAADEAALADGGVRTLIDQRLEADRPGEKRGGGVERS